MAKIKKSPYWAGVLWAENVRNDWRDIIDDQLQIPFSIILHDKDVCKDGTAQKPHYHILAVWNGPTTEENALNAFNELTAEGHPNCCSGVQPIRGMMNAYAYQIHDTESCKRQGKHLYADSERVTGNGFDINCYATVSEKKRMTRELADCIMAGSFTDFNDFTAYVMEAYPYVYFGVLTESSAFFDKLIRGAGGKYTKAVKEKLQSENGNQN